MDQNPSPQRSLLRRLGSWFGGKQTESTDITTSETIAGQTNITQKSPVASPVATKKTDQAVKKSIFGSAKNAFLDAFPNDKNLIGGAPMEMVIDGKKHVLAFRNEHIILDGNNYHIIKNNVSLDIEHAKRTNTWLNLAIGAFGKTETLAFEADELEMILRTLLQHATYKDEEKELVISRF